MPSEEDFSMKTSNKPASQPTNRFQDYLQKQPVFNWFARYENGNCADESHHSLNQHWMAKRQNDPALKAK